MRKFLLSLSALVLVVPMLGFAADIRSGEVIGKDQKPNNLYTAAQNPVINADVTGDLVVAGDVVTVNGNVSGGVLAAGSTLILNGEVGQSVRVAGGTVTINGAVAGDLVVFAGDVILSSNAVVSGDVIAFAGTVNVQGSVQGSVKSSYVGDVTISGGVAGNVELKSVGTVKVESSAVIGGVLKYSSQNEAVVATDAKVKGVAYTKINTTNTERHNIGSGLGGSIFGAIITFVTLIFLIRLFPKFTKNTVNSVLVNPWKKIAVGLLAIIFVPLVLFLLLFTVLGWGIMGFLTLAYIAVFALTGMMASLFVGSVIWKYIRKESELNVNWKAAATGVLIIAIVKSIPIIGWCVMFVLSVLMFGTLVGMGREYIKAQRA